MKREANNQTVPSTGSTKGKAMKREANNQTVPSTGSTKGKAMKREAKQSDSLFYRKC